MGSEYLVTVITKAHVLIFIPLGPISKLPVNAFLPLLDLMLARG
jgi:hypothetical protein